MDRPSFSKNKIAIIGAGNVGASTAYALTIKNIATEVLLVDINEDKREGEVMDIADGLCLVETGMIKSGTFGDVREADIIVVTAGVGRIGAGETRLNLVEKNKAVMQSIFEQVGTLRPSAIVIVISNPVDVLTAHVRMLTKLPPQQVFGTGTTLDTARLRRHVAKHFGVSAQNVHGYVLGEHGDSEFVAWSSVTIGGVPVTRLKGFTARVAKRIEESVRTEAYEIIRRKGATFYGIALVTTNIVEAIFYDQHLILPVTAELDGWNGISGVSLGAPAVICRHGIERHWPLALSAEEKSKLRHSAKIIKSYL